MKIKETATKKSYTVLENGENRIFPEGTISFNVFYDEHGKIYTVTGTYLRNQNREHFMLEKDKFGGVEKLIKKQEKESK